MLGEIGSLLGMLLAVAIILFLAWWVTSLVARQGVGGLLAAPGGHGKVFGGVSGELYVLRQIPVGRGERLVLVRLHERCLLLGVAQGGVSLLAELSEDEAAPWLEQPDAAPVDFRKLMRMSTKK